MPTRYGPHLAALSEHAVSQLTARHEARERALSVSRQVVRSSANAIRAVHRDDFDEARRLIAEASERLDETANIRTDNPEIYYAGFLSDARKEYTEANITLAVISGGEIPDAETLGIDPPAYLNGMAEVIGELRRYILDALRRDDTATLRRPDGIDGRNLRDIGHRRFSRGHHRRPTAQHRRHARSAGAYPRRLDHFPATKAAGTTAGPTRILIPLRSS